MNRHDRSKGPGKLSASRGLRTTKDISIPAPKTLSGKMAYKDMQRKSGQQRQNAVGVSAGGRDAGKSEVGKKHAEMKMDSIERPRAGKNVGKNNTGKNNAERSSVGKSRGEKVLTGAILITGMVIALSLIFYLHPITLADVKQAAQRGIEKVQDLALSGITKVRTWPDGPAATDDPTDLASDLSANENAKSVTDLDRTSELGAVSAFALEPVAPLQEDSLFTCMLDTALGPMLYYNQGDIRWKDYLYGGSDPMSRYGCGPSCVAMVINSFSSTPVSPIEMADWSAKNGGYALHGGSYHSLIPDSLSAFGLQVDSVTDRSAENAAELLRTGHILVALMGKGSLTQNGHFIVIAQLCSNGNVYIADPANYENCTKEWNLQQLMDELKESYDYGGPLWAVSVERGAE